MIPVWLFFLRNKQFTILTLLALLGAGLYAVNAIPKESAPEVRIPVGIVSTVLPGASAQDVEELITNEIESGVANLENVSKITSSSRESVSVVTVEFDANADLDKSIQDLKDAVDAVEPELPREVEDPRVSDVNFSEQPVLLISVTGNFPPSALTRLGEDLQNELESVRGVSRVDVSGTRAPQLQIIVQKDKLEQYGLSLSEVVAAIQSSNASLPVGAITIDGVKYALNFEGTLEGERDLTEVAVTTRTGATVYIRDLADIIDGLEESSSISRASVDGEPAAPSLSLAIYKSSGGNIAAVSTAVLERVDELKEGMLSESEVVIALDQGAQVQKDLSELTKVGLETILLVMLVLLATIGWREAIVAGLSVPLSFLIAFIGLWASGNTINFISLFSLILAIGILIDAGIVVVEAIHTRLATTKDKDEAAAASLREYAWPLIGGTMTTIAVFAPLFFISGIIGEFIKSIPFTIIFVLFASIFVALGLVPLIAVYLTRSEKNKIEKKQEEYFERFQNWYKVQLRRILDNRRFQNQFLVGIVVTLLISLSLPILGLVNVTFFPQEDIDFAYVEIETPQGTTLQATDLVTRQVEELLYDIDDIESFTTTVGASSAFSQNQSSGAAVANVTLQLAEDRDRTSSEIVADLRSRVRDVRGGEVRVFEPNNGPPSGSPVLITFSGNDLDALEETTVRAESILASIEGATEVTSSVKDTGLEFTLTIDRAKAAAAGLTPLQIAQTLRTAVQGTTATTIKNAQEDVDVIVKLDLNPAYTESAETTVITPDTLQNITIPTAQGPVLLGSVVELSASRGKATIRHEDRKRIETVASYVTADTTAPLVSAAFEEKAKTELTLPAGISMKVGGETEDINQSFAEMGFAFIAGIMLMLAILVLEFNSFRHTMYLLSIVPLSMIGVFVGLFITGQPLSFSSLLGIIALAGVIINHGIILLDSMHRISDAQHSLPFKEVVIEASASRLRAIFLTTITTVIGMIPLAGASALWGPLAFAIMFGLSFATVLTLIHIPILAYRWPGAWTGAKKK